MGLPKIEDMLGRAGEVTSTTTSTTYANLPTQTQRQFIDLLLPETYFLSLANVWSVVGSEMQVPNIDIADGQVTGGLGELEEPGASDLMIPVFGGRTLAPKSFEMHYEISKTILPQVNIEGDGFDPHLRRLAETYLNNEIDRICFLSDTGGSNPTGYHTGNQTTIDGWAKLADEGNVYDHDGGYCNPAIFKKLFYLMPKKWRNARKADMRYWVADSVEGEYRDYLSRRQDGLGTLALTEEQPLRFSGIPMIGVSYLPTDVDGINDKSETTGSYTYVVLAEQKNFALGFGPQMTFSRYPDKYGKFDVLNWWGQFDVDFARIEAVCKAVNVTPTVDSSLAVAY